MYTKSETTLDSHKNILLSNTIMMYKVKIKRLYQELDHWGLIKKNPEDDYPEFIHGLWVQLATHQALKVKAKKIGEHLSHGDIIQLLSDVHLELSTQLSLTNLN